MAAKKKGASVRGEKRFQPRRVIPRPDPLVPLDGQVPPPLLTRRAVKRSA